VTPTLTTARLLLTPLARSDAPAMVAVFADPASYEFIGGNPPTLVELEARFDRWAAGSGRAREAWHNWAVRLAADRQPIGHLQATVVGSGEQSSADIAWLVGTPWQGAGYASEAAGALVDWLRQSGVHAVTAHVHADHLASASIAARAGLAPTDEVDGGEVVWRLAL